MTVAYLQGTILLARPVLLAFKSVTRALCQVNISPIPNEYELFWVNDSTVLCAQLESNCLGVRDLQMFVSELL